MGGRCFISSAQDRPSALHGVVETLLSRVNLTLTLSERDKRAGDDPYCARQNADTVEFKLTKRCSARANSKVVELAVAYSQKQSTRASTLYSELTQLHRKMRKTDQQLRMSPTKPTFAAT